MGWSFPLRHANLVAYLSSPLFHREVPPRVDFEDLHSFLRSIGNEGRIWSNRKDWLSLIRSRRETALDHLSSVEASAKDNRSKTGSRSNNGPLLPEQVGYTLEPLREVFGGFPLSGLVVGFPAQHADVLEFTRYAGLSSGPYALFLSPDIGSDQSCSPLVLDPFPALARLTEAPNSFPGVVFWSQLGASAFLPFGEAQRFYEHMRKTLFVEVLGGHDMHGVATRVEEEIGKVVHRRNGIQLVHLSDLHCGKNAGPRAQETLLDQLRREEVNGVDGWAITGDLVDRPNERQLELYDVFKKRLSDIGASAPLVVPGNHDQRRYGNAFWRLGRDLSLLPDLKRDEVVVNDTLRMTFICFDSSRSGNFARGEVRLDMLQRMEHLLNQEFARNPAAEHYLRIVLVHHHPFPFDAANPGNIIQHALSFIGYSSEPFLAMRDSERFVNWCVSSDVSLILHGHKHFARHIRAVRQRTRGGRIDSRIITSIGCGTSLGAEQKPLTYSVVSWDPSSRVWASRVMEYEHGSGYGFVPRAMTIEFVA